MSADGLRAAMGQWASGVAIVACRHDGRVLATTVTSFMSLSLDPPLILIALGPNAVIRPFLHDDTRFAISILAASQRRLAAIYADPLPVGPDPFPATGDPVIEGSAATLTCNVTAHRDAGSHLLITAQVLDAQADPGAVPLVRHMRKYHALPK